MQNAINQNEFPQAPVDASSRRGLWGFAAVATLLALASVMLAILPHLFAYARYHNIYFYSNFDDQIYSAIAKTAYFDGWHVREPYTRPDEHVPSLYAPLLFVPYSAVTRLLQLDVLDILAVMRVLGGLLLGLTLACCLYKCLDRTKHKLFWVVVCGLIFLADSGTMGGRTIIGNFAEIAYTRLSGWPKLGDFLLQFRVAAVLLCLPFLILLVTSLTDIDSLRKRDIVVGIVSFVALIFTYFYYWVAAALLLGTLIAARAIKILRKKRNPLSDHPTLGLSIVLLAGLALGAPQIYNNARTFSEAQYKPILTRIARGQKLQPGDPIRFLHIRNYWALGKLLFSAFVIRMLRLWKLKSLWLLSAIGYLCTNLAVVFNIDFENHHWITVTNPISELLVLVLLAYCAERFFTWRRVRLAAPCLALIIMIPGATLRGMGTLRAEFGKDRTAALQRVLPLERQVGGMGSDCTIAGSSQEAEAIFQMSRCAMLFSTPYTALITPIPDQEVNERQALTYWLEGWTLDQYRKIAGYPMSWNSFGHPEWQPPFLVKARGEIFSRLEEDPVFRAGLISRYRPTHLVVGDAERQPSKKCTWKSVASASGVSIYKLVHLTAP